MRWRSTSTWAGPLTFTTLQSINVIYVKWDAIGINNGTSWADAYPDLHDAITSAGPGNDIWVASGTYSPTGNGTGWYRHFILKDGVEIYGGFDGTEIPGIFDLHTRNLLANETILHGCNNRFHVIWNTGVDTTALLDGFTITAGKANGDPLYPNLPHPYSGAGMYNDGSSPRIDNCKFYSNMATDLGGGMYNILEKPITLMPRGRRIVFYYPYTLYEQFIVGSLIVMILYAMGFTGLVLAYESTKYANKPRQAFMLLIVGVLLILSAYLGCQHLISLKIRGGA